MRQYIKQCIMATFALVIPSGLSGLAQAGGSDDFGCSNATLKGEYAFGVTSYTPPNLPNGPPAVVAGIKFFDGRGHLTQRDYSGDALRTRNPPRPISRSQGKKPAPTSSIATARAAWKST